MRIDRAPPCTTTRSVGRVPPDGLVTWTPARRVVRVVGSVRGGRGPGGDAAIVTRPGRSQAGWGGPHQGDDQQPANLGHGEREQAELADQAAASLCVVGGSGLGAVTTRKAWASSARVICRYQPGQRHLVVIQAHLGLGLLEACAGCSARWGARTAGSWPSTPESAPRMGCSGSCPTKGKGDDAGAHSTLGWSARSWRPTRPRCRGRGTTGGSAARLRTPRRGWRCTLPGWRWRSCCGWPGGRSGGSWPGGLGGRDQHGHRSSGWAGAHRHRRGQPQARPPLPDRGRRPRHRAAGVGGTWPR